MAQRHMERYSTSLIIRAIQIKITVSYPWQGCGEEEPLVHCWWECKQPPWRTAWRFLKTLKIEPPYDPVIPLLAIYPEVSQALNQKAVHPCFYCCVIDNSSDTEAAQVSTDERLRKKWCVYMPHGVFLSHRKDGDLAIVTAWMDVEGMMLSEISSRKRHTT